MDYLKIYEEEHIKNGLSYSEIRRKYNIPRGTWDYHVRKVGRKNADLRKHRCNDSFFDVMDSEIKAYLLGFLYADGYIAKDGRIGVLLNEKDEEIIKLIQEFIAPNSEIVHVNYQNFKRDSQVKIRFKSKQIYKRLLDYGFTTDKTHSECNILCKIPSHLKRHFVRGYCYGDGSVRYDEHHSKRNPRIFWVSLGLVFCNGTATILRDIQDFLQIQGRLVKKENYFHLDYWKQQDLIVIYTLLYTDCTYYLQRKYKNAMNSLNYCNNTELRREPKEFLTV